MRKELTAISAFSMAISFLASVVLCMQLAHSKLITGWQPTGSVLWGIEIAIFGIATYLWRQDVSLSGWSVGILALVAARLAITSLSALGLSFSQNALVFDRATALVSGFLPRMCGIVFALMICYPLRVFLPVRVSRQRKAAARAASASQSADEPALWFASKEDKPAATLHSPSEWHSFAPPTPDDRFVGVVEVPLRAVLASVPAAHLSSDARQYDATFPVALPLSLIGPQLSEARILLRLEDLRDLLPPRVFAGPEAPGLEGEPVVVTLALEDVVPQLPSRAFELPAPSPPAWASLPDPENVVFAVV